MLGQLATLDVGLASLVWAVNDDRWTNTQMIRKTATLDFTTAARAIHLDAPISK